MKARKDGPLPIGRNHGTASTRNSAAQVGARGWIGMTWPKRYGGGERSALERYVVLEEMLFAGAPVSFHWIADRQSGPLLLRYGTEQQRRDILPAHRARRIMFLHRPERAGCRLRHRQYPHARPRGGRRLARQRDQAVDDQRSPRPLHDRTVPHGRAGEPKDRHAGLSQFLVDLSLPGITIRPIRDLTGGEHFNEVVFDDALLPARR